jgi:hypothetical protein
VAARAGDDHAVKRGVELAVAAVVGSLALRVPEPAGIGATPAAPASFAAVPRRCAS